MPCICQNSSCSDGLIKYNGLQKFNMVSAFCSHLMHAGMLVEKAGGLNIGLPRWRSVVWPQSRLLTVYNAESWSADPPGWVETISAALEMDGGHLGTHWKQLPKVWSYTCVNLQLRNFPECLKYFLFVDARHKCPGLDCIMVWILYSCVIVYPHPCCGTLTGRRSLHDRTQGLAIHPVVVNTVRCKGSKWSHPVRLALLHLAIPMWRMCPRYPWRIRDTRATGTEHILRTKQSQTEPGSNPSQAADMWARNKSCHWMPESLGMICHAALLWK